MRMKALKTFSPSGGAVVHAGQEFDVSDDTAREYETGGMAIPVAGPVSKGKPEQTEGNPASEDGPTGSAGGRTGAGKQPSSSRADQAQKPHRSTRHGDERE